MLIHCNYLIPYPISDKIVKDSHLWGKDITFGKGERVLLTASSGNGKTTFINMILGLRKDYTGNLFVDGQDVRKHKEQHLAQIRKNRLSIVPQSLMLFDHLTALENVLLKNQITNFFQLSEIFQLMERLGILEHKNNPSSQLSYGQNQRLAIIRALCQPFDYLLLDEPFSHLDDKNIQLAWSLLLEYADRQNAGIIITSIDNHGKNKFTRKISL